MARAEVGDDVNGDDPTVIRMQEKMAGLLGMEAGLFVPSGTMSNAVAVRTHTQPGDEIIAEEHSHLYVYEGGGYAALSGCSIGLVPGHHGLVHPEEVKKRIRKAEGSRSHFPNASLICLENTSNRGGGTCYTLDTLNEIGKIAREHDCRMHLDGARLFNAVVATGNRASELVAMFDSVSIVFAVLPGPRFRSLIMTPNPMIKFPRDSANCLFFATIRPAKPATRKSPQMDVWRYDQHGLTHSFDLNRRS